MNWLFFKEAYSKINRTVFNLGLNNDRTLNNVFCPKILKQLYEKVAANPLKDGIGKLLLNIYLYASIMLDHYEKTRREKHGKFALPVRPARLE